MVRALIVDDVAENRAVLAHMLQAAGVDVETAEDGQQAVAQVAAARPDVVLMDIWMPQMDGIAAAQQLIHTYGHERPKLIAVLRLGHSSTNASAILPQGSMRFLSKTNCSRAGVSMPGKSFLHVEFCVRRADELPDAEVLEVVLPDDLYEGMDMGCGDVSRLSTRPSFRRRCPAWSCGGAAGRASSYI